MLTHDGKPLAENVECRRAYDQEAEQLHQLARIFKYHVKSLTAIMDNGSKVAFGPDILELMSLACLHLSQIWGDKPDENKQP